MKVFLICQEVDLGYHVVAVHSNRDKAQQVCDYMNENYKAKKIHDLVNHIGYTLEDATAYVSRTDQFFIEQHDME